MTVEGGFGKDQALTTLVPGQDGVLWHQGGYGPDVLQATSSLCEDATSE